MSKTEKDLDINQLIEYDDENDEANNANPTDYTADDAKSQNKDTYASLHTAGFREFLLKPELMRAIGDCGFEHPSEVQYECIPQAILGTDILCQAKSGMGKTAVFVLSVLQQIEPVKGQVSAIVLCHCRELAYQIRAEFARFSKYLPKVKTEVFFGGFPIVTHRELLKNAEKCPHIVIGTPGRVLQLSRENALNLGQLKYFVLDECDRMLESLDMRRDVQEIFRKTPHKKQVMMFSATLSDSIRPVCKKFMHNPLEIYINDGSKLTLHGLQQYYVELQETQKNQKLVDLLDQLDFNQVVVFVRSVSRAEELNRLLEECNFPSTCMHSGMKQEERIERYKKFKEFQKRIMVATDLFGRGIDIERVNVVINYDMAENSDAYLHRVGRAGRFGTKGLAVSFVSSDADATVLNSVQARFIVEVKPLPESIDPATYTTA